MQAIIDFIENYWGYTLVGTVSIGTVVAGVWAAVKMFIQAATAKRDQTQLNEDTNTLVAENKKLRDEVTNAEARVLAMQVDTTKVLTLLFEGLSYLIMASKLPNEDKMNLCNKFALLTNKTADDVTEASGRAEEKIEKLNDNAGNVKDKLTAGLEIAEGLIKEGTVQNIVEKASGLMNKYIKKED